MQRLVLWTLAMLTWIADVVLVGRRIDPRRTRQRGEVSIAWLKRWVIRLVIIRAAEIARPRRRRPLHWRGRHQRARHLIRSLIGSAFRRTLRHRDITARVRVLIGVLRDLDAHAHLIAKRMRRRLTRLRPIAAEQGPATPLPRPPLSPAAIADSS
ncbi:hypothetical protein [Terricaulis sp.]|uniref:hypothetical protein n=1 Tax=Terricaulis sp. TaxID=2768686 RepID=UPI003784334C